MLDDQIGSSELFYSVNMPAAASHEENMHESTLFHSNPDI